MGIYTYNKEITLKANVDEIYAGCKSCYEFWYWKKVNPNNSADYTIVGTEPEITVNVTEAGNYVAVFKNKKYIVSVISEYPELVTPRINGNDLPIEVDCNTGVQVILEDTYPGQSNTSCIDSIQIVDALGNILADNLNIGNYFPISNIINDVEYFAKIKLTKYVFSFNNNISNGSAYIVYNSDSTVSFNSLTNLCNSDNYGNKIMSEGEFDCNSHFMLVAVPNIGYKFSKWVGSSNSLTPNPNDSTVNPLLVKINGNCTGYIYPKFIQTPYLVNIQYLNNDNIEITIHYYCNGSEISQDNINTHEFHYGDFLKVVLNYSNDCKVVVSNVDTYETTESSDPYSVQHEYSSNESIYFKITTNMNIILSLITKYIDITLQTTQNPIGLKTYVFTEESAMSVLESENINWPSSITPTFHCLNTETTSIALMCKALINESRGEDRLIVNNGAYSIPCGTNIIWITKVFGSSNGKFTATYNNNTSLTITGNDTPSIYYIGGYINEGNLKNNCAINISNI